MVFYRLLLSHFLTPPFAMRNSNSKKLSATGDRNIGGGRHTIQFSKVGGWPDSNRLSISDNIAVSTHGTD
ncbi:MAG: hypothetical protein ACYTEO_19600 [Planctomycetota bacterium]|jgi:hypothetical protein